MSLIVLVVTYVGHVNYVMVFIRPSIAVIGWTVQINQLGKRDVDRMALTMVPQCCSSSSIILLPRSGMGWPVVRLVVAASHTNTMERYQLYVFVPPAIVMI